MNAFIHPLMNECVDQVRVLAWTLREKSPSDRSEDSARSASGQQEERGNFPDKDKDSTFLVLIQGAHTQTKETHFIKYSQRGLLVATVC